MNKHEVIIGDGEWQKKQELELREVNYGSNHRWFAGETEFDGHHVLWGFEYFPTTYLKESELSGNEYRKGGEIRFFKDRKQCFAEFCREPENAALRIGSILQQLMGLDWNQVKEGSKIWYERTPAVIKRVLDDQGCLILETEDGSDFPAHVWETDGEESKTLKVDLLSEKIFWYRA